MTWSSSDLMEMRKRELKYQLYKNENNINNQSDNLSIRMHQNAIDKKISNQLSHFSKPTHSTELSSLKEMKHNPSFFLGPLISKSKNVFLDTVDICGTLKTQSNVECTGDVSCSGNFVSSDLNLKDNINNIEDPFKIINQLKPVNYTYKGRNDIKMGFIAQDIEKIYPSIVKKDTNNNLSIDYINFIALLVKGSQDHEKTIQELINKINKDT